MDDRTALTDPRKVQNFCVPSRRGGGGGGGGGGIAESVRTVVFNALV